MLQMPKRSKRICFKMFSIINWCRYSRWISIFFKSSFIDLNKKEIWWSDVEPTSCDNFRRCDSSTQYFLFWLQTHMNLNGHFTLLIMLISICFFLPTPSSLTCWIQTFKISILTLCHFEIVLTTDSVYSLEKASKLPDYFELWPVTLFITSKSNGLMKIKTCVVSKVCRSIQLGDKLQMSEMNYFMKNIMWNTVSYWNKILYWEIFFTYLIL